MIVMLVLIAFGSSTDEARGVRVEYHLVFVEQVGVVCMFYVDVLHSCGKPYTLHTFAGGAG